MFGTYYRQLYCQTDFISGHTQFHNSSPLSAISYLWNIPLHSFFHPKYAPAVHSLLTFDCRLWSNEDDFKSQRCIISLFKGYPTRLISKALTRVINSPGSWIPSRNNQSRNTFRQLSLSTPTPIAGALTRIYSINLHTNTPYHTNVSPLLLPYINSTRLYSCLVHLTAIKTDFRL